MAVCLSKCCCDENDNRSAPLRHKLHITSTCNLLRFLPSKQCKGQMGQLEMSEIPFESCMSLCTEVFQNSFMYFVGSRLLAP